MDPEKDRSLFNLPSTGSICAKLVYGRISAIGRPLAAHWALSVTECFLPRLDEYWIELSSGGSNAKSPLKHALFLLTPCVNTKN